MGSYLLKASLNFAKLTTTCFPMLPAGSKDKVWRNVLSVSRGSPFEEGDLRKSHIHRPHALGFCGNVVGGVSVEREQGHYFRRSGAVCSGGNWAAPRSTNGYSQYSKGREIGAAHRGGRATDTNVSRTEPWGCPACEDAVGKRAPCRYLSAILDAQRIPTRI